MGPHLKYLTSHHSFFWLSAVSAFFLGSKGIDGLQIQNFYQDGIHGKLRMDHLLGAAILSRMVSNVFPIKLVTNNLHFIGMSSLRENNY